MRRPTSRERPQRRRSRERPQQRGILSLVRAIEVGKTPTVIQDILLESPELANEKFAGTTLMRSAVREGWPVEAVRLLHQYWPEAVRTRGDERRLPLHLVGPETPAESVEFLIDMYPEALRCSDAQERSLPIHTSIRSRASTDAVRVLVKRYPESLLVKDNVGLPIYIAVQDPDTDFDLVKFLVNRCPSSLSSFHVLRWVSVDDDDAIELVNLCRLPIHAAVETPGPNQLRILQLLTNRCPKSLGLASTYEEVDEDTQLLPIHLAVVEQGAHQVEIIELFVSQRPNGLLATTAFGFLPVHKALLSESSVAQAAVIQRLSSEPVPEETKRGLMHFLLRSLLVYKEWWEEVEVNLEVPECHMANVRALAEALPDTLRATDAEGSLPIHVAVHLNNEPTPTMNLVRLFVALHPLSLLRRNAAGAIPLHIALEHARDMTMAEFLFESCPESAAVAGRDGNLPIHAALANRWYGLVNRIVELSPAGSQGRGARGRTLAHVAATLQCDDEEGAHQLLEAAADLVGSWPESLLERDADGNLPIHVAIDCLTGDWACTFVRFLMERNRDSLRVADARGRLPLHVAVSTIDPSPQLAMQLADEWDGALEARDASGSVPLQLAIANPTASLELIYSLVRTRPDFVPDVLM